MYRENILRKRLLSRQKVFGCIVQILDPAVTEILSLVGFDFLLVDNEHGPGDIQSAVSQLRAAAATDTTLVVRIPWNDTVYLKKILDVGAEAVMVPMVETAEKAASAVAGCRYPPRGIRGVAHTDARASDYGLRAMDYLETASDNIFIICQIETETAVNNAKSIAAVDGVDMVLIGPFDLSASLGRPADFNNPKHRELMSHAETAVKEAGKFLGTTCYGGRSATELFDRGYDLIIGKADVGMLRDAALQLVAKNKPNA